MVWRSSTWAAASAAVPANFIDSHVLSKLERLNLPPADLCDDATFFRRLHLDVTGKLPPSEAIRPPPDAVRMIAVPTTLSAAEFNAFAGISDPRHGIKESFGHRLIVPQAIVLDPAATLATPMDLMLSTGLKAVDHAVERLCSHQAHPFVLGTATEALRLLARALPAVGRPARCS